MMSLTLWMGQLRRRRQPVLTIIYSCTPHHLWPHSLMRLFSSAWRWGMQRWGSWGLSPTSSFTVLLLCIRILLKVTFRTFIIPNKFGFPGFRILYVVQQLIARGKGCNMSLYCRKHSKSQDMFDPCSDSCEYRKYPNLPNISRKTLRN